MGNSRLLFQECVIERRSIMKRIVITNNRKVAKHCANRADVSIKDMASGLDVLQEGLKIARRGTTSMDPTRRKGYYKSLIFYLGRRVRLRMRKALLC